MATPAAIKGSKLDEAKRLKASGSSNREIGRLLGVDHKTVAKTLAKTQAKPAKPKTPKHDRPTRKPTQPVTTAEELLELELADKVALTQGLRDDFEAATDPRDRVAIAKGLVALHDANRRMVAGLAPPDEQDTNDDADNFDSHLLALVAKARVVVNAGEAVSGLPGEAEPAGEVGARAGAAGTDG